MLFRSDHLVRDVHVFPEKPLEVFDDAGGLAHRFRRSADVHRVVTGTDADVEGRADQAEVTVGGPVKRPAARRVLDGYGDVQRVSQSRGRSGAKALDAQNPPAGDSSRSLKSIRQLHDIPNRRQKEPCHRHREHRAVDQVQYTTVLRNHVAGIFNSTVTFEA